MQKQKYVGYETLNGLKLQPKNKFPYLATYIKRHLVAFYCCNGIYPAKIEIL